MNMQLTLTKLYKIRNHIKVNIFKLKM